MCLFSSCNFINGEHKKDYNGEVQYKSSDSYAPKLRTSLNRYFSGSADPSDIENSIDCIRSNISKFLQNTRGEPSDVYKLEAINSFFRNYLPELKEFDSQSVQVYLKLKSVLMGGSDSSITKSELEKINLFLLESRDLLSKMTPYIGIYTFKYKFNLKNDSDRYEIEKSLALLEQLQNKLLFYFPGKTKNNFYFGQVDKFSFLKAYNFSGTPSQSSFVEVFKSLQSILVGSSEEYLESQNWPELIKQFTLLLKVSIRLNHFSTLKTFRDSYFTRNVALFKSDLDKLIIQALNLHNGQQIPNLQFENLIRKLEQHKLLGGQIRADSLIHLIPVVFNHIFMLPDEKFNLHTLNLARWQRFTYSIDEWLCIQNFFLDLHSQNMVLTADILITELNQFIKENPNHKFLNSFLKLREVMGAGSILRWRDPSTLLLEPRNTSLSFSDYDLIFLSSSFSVISTLIPGYAKDRNRRSGLIGLTEDELNELYRGFKEIGSDLKFIDSRNNAAGSRTFLETNIFMSVSNGNNIAEFHEILEWFYQAYSASQIGKMMYHDSLSHCRTSTLDVYGREKLSHDCFDTFLKSHIAEYFLNLTAVSGYFSELYSIKNSSKSSAEWTSFITALENAYRSTGFSSDDYDSSDMQSLSLILAYTESLFRNYDKDNSGMLNNKELWNAFPVMKGFIIKLSNGKANNKHIQESAFSYMLEFGKMPDTSNNLKLAMFIGWTAFQYFLPDSAKLPDIVRIISNFSINSRTRRKMEIENFYINNKDRMASKILSGDHDTIEKLQNFFVCKPESKESFKNFLIQNIDNYLPSKTPLQPEEFHTTIERLIKANPKLENECLPFE